MSMGNVAARNATARPEASGTGMNPTQRPAGMGFGGMMPAGQAGPVPKRRMAAGGQPYGRAASGQAPSALAASAPSFGATPSQVLGDASGENADEEIGNAQQTVRSIGNRAFYRRGGQWINSTLSKVQEKNPTRLKQFSKEYFSLAKRYGRSLAQYLVFDEPVVVNLEGHAYLIEP